MLDTVATNTYKNPSNHLNTTMEKQKGSVQKQPHYHDLIFPNPKMITSQPG